MFSAYYKTELDYLQQLCEELGERSPDLSPILGRDADPDVSRLLQNLAFVFGRLRQRLDDDLPEVIHPIIESLCPALLRPIPSTTVMELVPESGMATFESIAVNAAFASRPVDGVACIFRSVEKCDVRPWAIRRVDVSSDRLEVKMTLDVSAGAALEGTAQGALRLFLALPVPMALDLRNRLLRGCQAVFARDPATRKELQLAPPVVPARASSALDPRLAPSGAAALLRLREYFVSPEQFAFLEIPEIERLLTLGEGVRTFEIAFQLREPLPRAMAFTTATFRLHCVTAENVFRPPLLQLPLMGASRRCDIRFDDPEAELFSIEKVSLVRTSFTAMPADPWSRLLPPLRGGDGATPLLYRLRRAPSVLGRLLDVSLTFVSRAGEQALAEGAGADLTVLATNGLRAARVGLGDVCVGTASSPSQVTFRNITAASRAAAPALDSDRLWRVFDFFKASLPRVTKLDYLASVLSLVNVPAWAQWPDAKPDADRFVPLLAVRRRREDLPSREGMLPGAKIEIDVDLSRFAGLGDAAVFGELLGPIIASTLRSHEWIELVLCDDRGSRMIEYPRLFGTKRGL